MTVALIFGVTGAWADEITATLVHTASSYSGGTAGVFTSTIDAENEHINNTNFKNPWAGAAYAEFSFEIPAGQTVQSATLTWSGLGSGKDRTTDVMYTNAGLALNYATEGEDALGSGTGKADLAATPIINVKFPKNKTTNFTTDVTDAVKTTAASQSYVIFKFTNNAGGGDLKGKGSDAAPVLVISTVSAASQTSYTVKFTDIAGNELKEAVTYDVLIGNEATASTDDMASFFNADKTMKYIYASGNQTITAVASAESNVITLVFREAEKFAYTLKSNLGATLKEGSDWEGETLKVAFPRYQLQDGTLYSIKAGDKNIGYFQCQFTLNENNHEETITYSESTTDVVFYSEAETIETLTVSNAANADIRCSDGLCAYNAGEGDAVIATLPNGKYKLYTSVWGNKTTEFVFKANGEQIYSIETQGYILDGNSEEFEVNNASNTIALGATDNAGRGIDFVYIVKTGDAELAAPVPAVGIMDFNKMDIPVSSSGNTDGDITEDKILTADDFSVTISPKTSGTTNNRFWNTNNGPQLRIYNGTLTVKAAAGKVLDKIVFDQSKWGTVTASVGTLEGKTWTGEAEEVIFTVNTQCQINSITVGEAPAEPLVDVADIAAFKALAAGTRAKLAVNGTKVTFVSGDNAYIEDETGALLLYKSGLTLTAGKALTGYINGAYSEFNGLAELTAIEETAASEFTEADTEIVATVVTVAEANTAESVSKLVKLENVKINADYQTITQGEDEIGFYDKFGVMGDFVYPETAKSIVGIINTVSGYNTFHPISPDNVVADTPNPPAGDDEIIALTADMFYTWDGYGADANKLSPATVDFNIGNDAEIGSGGMVCGTSTVDDLTYADITGSSKLIIEGTTGMALRVLLNRQGNGGPLTEINPTIGEDGTAEVDLTNLDKEYVHINAIKANWGSTTGKINSIKFVKPSDALAIPKEALKNVIETAKLHNAVAKTEESYAALQTAIANGEAALAAEDATEESLTAAKNAIEEAIAGLTLMEGYSDLTKEMFMEYASFEEPGEGKTAYGAYSLFEASSLPYGDGNVNYLLWADLSTYDKLIITTVGETKPRLCMNRLTADGQQAETKENSKMVDINPNNDFIWSTEAYQTIDENVYTIDLKKIVEDFTFARLHCIKKQGWGSDVFVTGMYLYKAAEKPIVYTDMANIAALKANKANLDVKLAANNLQVTVLETGEQGSTMYVEDETGGIQMNDANGIFTEFGQTFNGTLALKLVYDNEQNILSLETTDLTATESEFTSEVKDVVAKEVALIDATSANYDLQLIKVMNVGMASKNIAYGEGEEDFNTVIVLTDGEKELLINDMFGKLAAETLYDKCNATGIIMTSPEYNDNHEIVGTVDIFVPTGVGIEEIVPVETGRKWDFTAMSEADEALLAADTEHWTVNKYRYQNNGIAFNDEVIKVNGVELDVTKGLLFTAEATKLLLGSGVNGSNHFMQVQKGSSFKVTGLAVGDTVRMVVQTSSKNAATAAAPAASVANIIEGFEAVTEAHTCTFVMCEAGDIVLKGDNCDLRFLTLEVKAGNPNEVANLREWNFTAWSEETKNNLAADAATITPDEEGKYPTVTPWRSYEKVGGPTETDPDRGGAAYWYGTAISGAEELTANGTVIAETKGLLFNTMSAGALAIAIDYPATSLGTYEGSAYLWIGGKNNSFTIPNVKSGSKITLGAESHKNTDARGVKLSIDGNEIGSAVPTTFETFEITVPGELTDGTLSDVVVTNTNGCHIYYITVDATGKIIDGISEIKTEVKVINNGVYTIDGVKVRNAGESLSGLAKGMYIIGGKKIIIK